MEKNVYFNELPNDYIVFDVETTGLDPRTDKITEIGALKYKDNKLIDKFQKLINPRIHITAKIYLLTGINDEMVKNCSGIENVLPDFIKFIENYTLVAHNAKFDTSFIACKLQEHNMSLFRNKVIDTLYLSREALKYMDSYSLAYLKDYFKLSFGSHRAIEDCYTTNYVYQYCKASKRK